MMKKIICLIACLQLAGFGNVFSQNSNITEITYIGNEGFMISHNNKKVFIDALYYYSYGGGVLNVDTTVQNLMINGKKPFSDINLFLITHNHPDHYDQTMMKNFLKNNSQAKLVAQSDIITGIGKDASSKQLIGIQPKQYEYVDTVVNGIPLTVYNLIHAPSYRTYNIGYVANVGGINIFHSGDNVFDDTLEYSKFKINEKNIDVVFLSYYGYWKSKAQRDLIKKYINPKYIVLMHIPTFDVEATKQNVKQINDAFAPLIVFNTSMETIKIENDTFVFTNSMPQIIATIKDTVIQSNTAININVSSLFNDADVDDSLSYSVSGLPSGFLFNPKMMTISGSSLKLNKTSNYTIKITATDKNLCSNSTTFKMTIEVPSGLDDNINSNIEIYPNPVKDELKIRNFIPNSIVHIYDTDGKLVYNERIMTDSINVSKLAIGTYTVKIFSSNNVFTNRMIKK